MSNKWYVTHEPDEKQFKIPVDIFVYAENSDAAVDIASEELEWLCGLDNSLTAVSFYTSKLPPED